MPIALFRQPDTESRTKPVWQWDYGQKIEIHGLSLPPAVEVHFATDQDTETVTRIGTTIDNVTSVTIPDSMLEQTEEIIAYIYIVDSSSGKTKYTIKTYIQPRPQPQQWEPPETEDLFRETIAAVNDAADRAEAARDTAEGHSEVAAEAAQDARDCAKQIPGQVDTAKADIDKYVANKEAELKGDTGNVYFASFKVVGGRLKMYSDPAATKIAFTRRRSRLSYRVRIGG